MGSDESHFTVCGGQSHKTVSRNYNLYEEKGEPKQNRAELAFLLTSLKQLPLGQTGSHGRRSAGDCRHNMHLSIPSIVYRPTLHGVRLGGLKIAL